MFRDVRSRPPKAASSRLADGLCLASQRGIDILTGQALNLSTAIRGRRWCPARSSGRAGQPYYFWTNSGAACYALNLETGKLVTVTRSASAVHQDRLARPALVATGTTIRKCSRPARAHRPRKARSPWPSVVDLGWAMAER